MASLNKVQIIGNLGGDPEVRYTAGGAAVANFSVATTEKWKDKQTGETQEETEWHRVVLWGRLAEIAGEYLKKGLPVYIEGRNKTEKWTDNQGVERYTTKVIGSDLKMLGGKPQGGEGGGGGQRQQRPQDRSTQLDQRRQPQQTPPQQGGFDDDDIPF